jgi:hypothetical protein
MFTIIFTLIKGLLIIRINLVELLHVYLLLRKYIFLENNNYFPYKKSLNLQKLLKKIKITFFYQAEDFNSKIL